MNRRQSIATILALPFLARLKLDTEVNEPLQPGDVVEHVTKHYNLKIGQRGIVQYYPAFGTHQYATVRYENHDYSHHDGGMFWGSHIVEPHEIRKTGKRVS